MSQKLPAYSLSPCSESAWLISFEPVMEHGLNHVVHTLAAAAADRWPGQVEAVPAYASLLLRFSGRFTVRGYAQMTDAISDWLRQSIRPTNARPPGEPVQVPVCYHPDLGNDLDAVATDLGLSHEAIVAAHCRTVYRVFMVGFRPGFPYMGVLPSVLEMPRKSKPVFTPAGAVAIAGKQTGIYPTDGPGGWHILGYTPMRMFDIHKDAPARLQPGATVQFYPISVDTYREGCL